MLFQKKCLPQVLFIFVYALLFGTGCGQNEQISPEGYDLSKPKVIPLGKVLNEVSGICLDKEDNDLLAISDSKEQVFEMDLRNIKLHEYTGKVVPPESDIEDVVKVNSKVYMLKSRGEIVEVPERARDTTGVKTYPLNIGGSNDFESLYHDPTADGLILICKSCENEKGGGVRTAYRFDLKTKTFDSTAFFTISKEDVKAAVKNSSIKFDPSAAAIHPLSKRLYILSAESNLLVIADTRGQVIEGYELDRDLFPKAEGIAFANNGGMFIVNEAKYGPATLLYFPYQPAEKKK
jgi:hypothetical protein